MDRYSRQTILNGVGAAGQELLGRAHAAVVGLGALGSAVSEILVRAGVGRLRLIDRDVLELHNLQRQSLYTEEDVAARLPKAEAARLRLGAINSSTELEARTADLNGGNAVHLLSGADLIVDGTDNFEVRYLLNDVAVSTGRPWVYGGVLGTEGVTASIRPGQGPCLRCLFRDPPPPGSVATCETAGVWSPTVHVVAAMQASAALQLLLGADPPGGLLHVDPWSGRLVRLEASARDPDCPACGNGQYEFLEAASSGFAVRPCGGGSVHVSPPQGSGEIGIDLDRLTSELERQVGTVRRNEYLLQFQADGCEFTLFKDGRALIKGTEDPGRARSLYSRYVGN